MSPGILIPIFSKIFSFVVSLNIASSIDPRSGRHSLLTTLPLHLIKILYPPILYCSSSLVAVALSTITFILYFHVSSLRLINIPLPLTLNPVALNDKSSLSIMPFLILSVAVNDLNCVSPVVSISPNRFDSYITSICFNVFAISTPIKVPSLNVISPLPDSERFKLLISEPVLFNAKLILASPKRSAAPITSINKGSVCTATNFD